MSVRASAITGILIFVTTIVATGSFYANTLDGILAAGTVWAITLFIPFFAAATLLQIVISRISRNLQISWKNRLVLWPVCIGVVSFGWLVSLNAIDDNRKKAFEVFFSEKPPNSNFVSYSYSRSLLGGGTYLLMVKMQSNEAKNFLLQQGYAPADIDARPGALTYDDVLARMAGPSYRINDSFACYLKIQEAGQLRIYFDPERDLYLCIGFGPKRRASARVLNSTRQP